MKTLILFSVTTVCILFFIQGYAQKQLYKAYPDSTLIKFFQRSEGWIASDGAISIPLSDGRILWTMGDSHIDDYDPVTKTIPALFQVRNCVLMQPKGDWDWHHTRTMIGNGPGIKSYFKEIPDDDYFIWPGGGFQLGDTVYVYLGNLKKTGKGAWDWGAAGNDLWGKIKFPEMGLPVAYTPLPEFTGVVFGQGFVKDQKNKVIYAFGSKLGSFGVSAVYVATMPIDNPNAKWSFWNGKDWTRQVNEIKPVDTARAGVYVTKIRDKYVLISSELSVACDMGRSIFAATSDSPTGPFTALKKIYTITDTVDGHYPFFYTVIPHPEYINDKDELLITYCINGYDPCMDMFKTGRGNPDYYRPKGVRVPLKMIDPSF